MPHRELWGTQFWTLSRGTTISGSSFCFPGPSFLDCSADSSLVCPPGAPWGAGLAQSLL